MKKLIALFAASTVASTAAVAGVALSGTASVSYDDNGSAASATTYDADMTVTGTSGGTTLTASYDMEGTKLATTAATLATTVGMLTISADMFNEVSAATTSTGGGQIFESTDTSVTVSLDVPVGDMTIGVDNSGDVVLSGTFSGVTVSQTIGDTNSTTLDAAIAGIDMSVTNKGGATTWTLDTTVSAWGLSSGVETASGGVGGRPT